MYPTQKFLLSSFFGYLFSWQQLYIPYVSNISQVCWVYMLQSIWFPQKIIYNNIAIYTKFVQYLSNVLSLKASTNIISTTIISYVTSVKTNHRHKLPLIRSNSSEHLICLTATLSSYTKTFKETIPGLISHTAHTARGCFRRSTMGSNKAISINFFLYCLLPALFKSSWSSMGLLFFQKYLKKETITVSSREFTKQWYWSSSCDTTCS